MACISPDYSLPSTTVSTPHRTSSSGLVSHEDTLGDENGKPMILCSLSDDELQNLEKKLIKKLDKRLLAALFVGYYMCIMDRANYAAAKTAGVENDLGIAGNKSLCALSVYYVGNIVGQIPSNLWMAKMGKPAHILSVGMAVFGILSVCSGVTQNFEGIVACRFLLGLFESCYFPGATYFMSSWYTRKELAARNAFFFSAQFLASASSSLIVAVLLKVMDGATKDNSLVAPWRCLYYVSGGLTFVLALFGPYVMPNLPETTRFLAERELAMAKWRLYKDAGSDDGSKASWKGLQLALKDGKAWIFALLSFAFTSFGSVAIVFPTVVAGLGYSKVKTNLLTAPPFILAAVLAIVNGEWAKRSQRRYPHIIVPLCVAFVAFIIAATTVIGALRYFSIMFMVIGNTAYPIVMTWLANSLVRPASLRASAIAAVSVAGCVNHIYSPFIFQEKYAPRMRLPLSLMAGFVALAMLTATAILLVLTAENRRLDAGTASYVDGKARDLVDRDLEKSEVTVPVDASFRYIL